MAASKVREELTAKFLAALNQGEIPWRACWAQNRPVNATTGKPYRGINNMMLSYMAEQRGYADPRWCTYNQAQERGWQVRKGEKSARVEYWAYYDLKDKKMLSWPEARKRVKEDPAYIQNLQLRCRCYTVFNAEQMDGIPKLEPAARTDIGQLRQQRDTLLTNMGVDYREQGSQPYYSPAADCVVLPPEATFESTYAYMATFLHECGHATGHETRLNRDMTGAFGSEDYAREELRAEIASAFTAQALGMELTEDQLADQTQLHMAYVQHWASVIRDAPEELFRAIHDAEKISDYLLEKGEFQQGRQQTAETLVGRIDYLSSSGNVRESVDYTSAYQLKKDIQEENYYGTPMMVTLYRQPDGTVIPHDYIFDCDPPLQGFSVADQPEPEEPELATEAAVDDGWEPEF